MYVPRTRSWLYTRAKRDRKGADQVPPNERLRAVRMQAGMSRTELAAAATEWLQRRAGGGSHRCPRRLEEHSVGRYERGNVGSPHLLVLAALRHVLKVTTDAELGFPGNAEATGANTGVEPRSTIAATDLLAAAAASTRYLPAAEHTNIGDLSIEQLHTEVRRVASSYLKQPAPQLFIRTIQLRDHAFELLAGRQPPRRARDLYAAAGWALTMLAWMSVDLGSPDAADDHLRVALACARNAEVPNLAAWVRATQHTAAYWRRDFRGAAAYANAGSQEPGVTGTAATFLASAHAVDLARLGQHNEARCALDRAHRLADDAELRADEMGGPLTCTPARAASLWSDAYLVLGDAASALSAAKAAVDGLQAASPDVRNVGSLRMSWVQVAKAHLVDDALDGAAQALASVLATPPAHRVGPLRHRTAEIKAMLSGSTRTAAPAMDIIAAIDDFNSDQPTHANPRDEA